GARARGLGWQPLPTDDEDTRLLRPALVRLVADAGADETLRAQATELARRWLADRTAVQADVVEGVLGVAAQRGDQALFDAFLAEARRAPERRDRRRLLHALAQFRDPKLAAAALDLTLAKDFDARETSYMLFVASGWPTTRAAAWDFVERSYEALEARWAAD